MPLTSSPLETGKYKTAKTASILEKAYEPNVYGKYGFKLNNYLFREIVYENNSLAHNQNMFKINFLKLLRVVIDLALSLN